MCPKNIKDYPLNKILIIGLSCLGDNLLITPAIKLIKDSFKKAEVDIVIGPRSIEFVRNNPWFSNYFVYNKKKMLSSIINLRKKRYDLIVDFRNSLLPFLLKGKFKLTFFWKEFTSEKFFTHESERIVRFLEPFFGKPEEIRLYFPFNNSDKEKISEIFKTFRIKKSDLIIVLNPGANFIHKRWKKENFAELGKILISDYGAKIIIIGGSQEITLAEEIKSLIGNTNVFSIAGKLTLQQLAALFEESDLLITNDTGPMHLASAVQCPVVAIFGPGNPYRYGPIGTKNYVVHIEIDCFPCRIKRNCKKNFICMSKITVSDVIKSVRLILDEDKQLSLFDIE